MEINGFYCWMASRWELFCVCILRMTIAIIFLPVVNPIRPKSQTVTGRLLTKSSRSCSDLAYILWGLILSVDYLIEVNVTSLPACKK